MNINKKLNDALNLFNKGNLAKSRDILIKIHSVKPQNTEVLNHLAIINFRTNNRVEAINCLKQSLNIKFDSSLAMNLFLMLEEFSDWNEIINFYVKFKNKYKFNTDLLLLVAKAYRENKNHSQSLLLLQEIYETDNANINVIISYSYTLNMLEKYNESIKVLEEAVGRGLNNYHIFYNLGISYGNLSKHLEAIKYLSKASEIEKNDINLWLTLANQANLLRDVIETQKYLEEAKKINPSHPLVIFNEGFFNLGNGNVDKALQLFETVIKSDPNNIEANYFIGLALLMKNEYKKAMPFYSYRCKRKNYSGFFDDSDLKEIKSTDNILIAWEQGIGDQILYLRLMDNFIRHYPNVTYISIDKLYPLLKYNFPEINIVKESEREDFLIEHNFDVKLNLGSLIHYVDETSLSLNESRWLKAIPNNQNPKTNLTNKIKKIGISWKSNGVQAGKDKSITLDKFSPLFDIENCLLVNLQYGDIKNELESINKNYKTIIHLDEQLDYFNDMEGLVNIIESCDIVITTSNVTAHLSGAMGKKSLILIPYSYGKLWYWYEKMDRSKWYPNTELFLQEKDEKWETVIRKVKKRAEELISFDI